MTFALYLLGMFFILVAAAAAAFGLEWVLPAVMATYFIGNTPLSKAITEPLPWHLTFMGIDLVMMFYCLTFNTLIMNGVAVAFMGCVLLYLFIMFGAQWAARLHGQISMFLITLIVAGVATELALQGVKSM